jgi:hypothetical protein
MKEFIMNTQIPIALQPRLTRGAALLAILAAAAAATTASADHYISQAFGHQLEGGRLAIFWGGQGGGVVTVAPILGNPLTQTGFARVPAPAGGFAEFSVSGDTYMEKWSIVNDSANSIIWADFNLLGSASIFDTVPLPFLSQNSARGRLVEYVLADSTAPTYQVAFDYDPDPHPHNQGDMHWGIRIVWGTSLGTPYTFAPQQTFVWYGDTDLIPAPGTLALLGAGGLLAFRRRR